MLTILLTKAKKMEKMGEHTNKQKGCNPLRLQPF